MGDLTAPARVWNGYANAVRAGTTKSGPNATKGKPFVISETGAAGIYGARAAHSPSPSLELRVAQNEPGAITLELTQTVVLRASSRMPRMGR